MLLLGTVVSAITAFAAVKWLLTYLQRNNFVAFGWYRIILGAVILIYLGQRRINGGFPRFIHIPSKGPFKPPKTEKSETRETVIKQAFRCHQSL